LRHIDQSRLAPRVTFVRSSLHDAGFALIAELSRQCDEALAPSGVMVASSFQVAPGLDGSSLDEPMPASRRGKIG
jgi:LacI family transcriptional regulator